MQLHSSLQICYYRWLQMQRNKKGKFTEQN
jgi:hypothetical protein